jgi:hypothetical protein
MRCLVHARIMCMQVPQESSSSSFCSHARVIALLAALAHHPLRELVWDLHDRREGGSGRKESDQFLKINRLCAMRMRNRMPSRCSSLDQPAWATHQRGLLVQQLQQLLGAWL